MQTTSNSSPPVVVIGAGLAGLAAAATAARAGAQVVIVDASLPGGRARTHVRDGFRFNQGPRALYRAGHGRRVLARLGVQVVGHPAPKPPPLPGSRALVAGHPRPFPRWLAGKVYARASAANPARQAGRSASEWIDSLRLSGAGAAYLGAFIRLVSYVGDLDRMPAEVAIGQLRLGLRGVDYLDGGWQQLIYGLATQALSAGADIRPHTRVERLEPAAGGWEIYSAGEVICAASVVVALSRPAAALRLLPFDPGWGDTGPEVTAACLDLGLRHPGVRFTIGIDEPVYLSPHCPPGDLAPAGSALAHLLRYGAGSPEADRDQLWRLAAAAGISDGDVAVQRFLPHMMVTSSLPPPSRGLAGRPPVVVSGAQGLFLAGDWVGPDGWLADGSLASGERAGLLAAQRAAGRPPATEDARLRLADQR